MFAAGNYVDYAYDSIGQLKTAFGKEPGGVTNRLQEQLGYAYDAAGNLNYRTNNGFLQTFNVNSLNELTTASRSGTFTVAGATTGAATNVTVNTSNATLYVDQTFASTNHSLTTTFKTYTAVAQDSYGRTDTNSVTAFKPLGPVFEYDLNGNLLFERSAIGVTNRLFAYDDENQLITVWITNSWKSEFVYDGTRRCRIEKNYAWQSGAWVQTNEVRFIYDGNVPIQHRDGNNLPVQAMTRGRDLSGSLQGAGGIGGLLALTENAALNPEHSYYYGDGSGNVTMLISTNQMVSGRYGYDPFGYTLSISGPKAFANRYRSSSKPICELPGLVYYLNRFYDPSLQRWLTRDPLGEFPDGPNLYAFVGNNPIDAIDPLGLAEGYIEFRHADGRRELIRIPDPDPNRAQREFRQVLWDEGGKDTAITMIPSPFGKGRTAARIGKIAQEAGWLARLGNFLKKCKFWEKPPAKTPPHFSGTAQPWTRGATPASIYTHIDPRTGKAVQNAVYDSQGNVVGHVDFKNHGPGASSGHGHTFPQPGNPASGHGPGNPHIPNNQLPPGWDVLPPGVQPRTPIGQ